MSTSYYLVLESATQGIKFDDRAHRSVVEFCKDTSSIMVGEPVNETQYLPMVDVDWFFRYSDLTELIVKRVL